MNRQELTALIKARRSFLCVGLDTDPERLPECLRGEEDPSLAFNKAIVDATAPYCVAFKPNVAFYEARGAEGVRCFEETVRYIRSRHPEALVIADAKRGDIGNTAALYARAFFDRYGVDAVTVAPYMGRDSVTPFLGREGKWVILLALTSNKGSLDFQTTEDRDGEALFERVLRKSREWAGADSMMYVAGATQGRALERVRRLVPDHFLLVPGVGAQGGSLEEVCRYGMNKDCGLIVNSSRAIIYADNTENFAEAAAGKARETQLQMAEQLRTHGI